MNFSFEMGIPRTGIKTPLVGFVKTLQVEFLIQL